MTATVMAAGALAPTPALASASSGYISGSGAVNDDFGDEGTLRRGNAYANSGATGLWQTILYADGFLTQDQIDCQFGPATETATKNWQSAYGLTADGIVGTGTFGRADVNLFQEGSHGSYLVIRYSGARRAVYFERLESSGGRYLFRNANGTDVYYLLTASYNGIPTGC
ncbi:peptidoglycan-binding domain-containing protein [Micromonospora chersina]|uniref:peptidoglycan-binding domain-containing protein n=1 Tax=Micromonospora chersina TaxID=47854 RepID=UPI003719B853